MGVGAKHICVCVCVSVSVCVCVLKGRDRLAFSLGLFALAIYMVVAAWCILIHIVKKNSACLALGACLSASLLAPPVSGRSTQWASAHTSSVYAHMGACG